MSAEQIIGNLNKDNGHRPECCCCACENKDLRRFEAWKAEFVQDCQNSNAYVRQLMAEKERLRKLLKQMEPNWSTFNGDPNWKLAYKQALRETK